VRRSRGPLNRGLAFLTALLGWDTTYASLVRWVWFLSILAVLATLVVGTEMHQASRAAPEVQAAGWERQPQASLETDRDERQSIPEGMDLVCEEDDDNGDALALFATELHPHRVAAPSRDRVETHPSLPEAPGYQRRAERPPRA
jgi:hypothetical protein